MLIHGESAKSFMKIISLAPEVLACCLTPLLWSPVVVSRIVFLLQLCMTGVLVILLRADIPLFSLLPQEKYANVSARWYSVVGAPLIKTMVINFIAPTCVHGKCSRFSSRL